MDELVEEIRRLKSLLVKHEKRIRALEAKTQAPLPAQVAVTDSLSVSTSMSPGTIISDQVSPNTVNNSSNSPTAAINNDTNHVSTHDTNANLSQALSTEEMAPDEV